MSNFNSDLTPVDFSTWHKRMKKFEREKNRDTESREINRSKIGAGKRRKLQL
jgi:hypothetical protein